MAVDANDGRSGSGDGDSPNYGRCRHRLLALPASIATHGFDRAGGLVYGTDALMAPKDHGTTATPVQAALRYGVSRPLAARIASRNRTFAERGGYCAGRTAFAAEVRRRVAETGGPAVFYDSVSGRPLFRAPVHRSVDAFLAESAVHGWPSFRDAEVLWDDVRVLRKSGETVSTAGTHLGHNIPDTIGNRYRINLVSISGSP